MLSTAKTNVTSWRCESTETFVYSFAQGFERQGTQTIKPAALLDNHGPPGLLS